MHTEMIFKSEAEFETTLGEVLKIVDSYTEKYCLPYRYFKAYFGNGKFLLSDNETEYIYAIIDDQLQMIKQHRHIYSEAYYYPATIEQLVQSGIKEFLNYPTGRVFNR